MIITTDTTEIVVVTEESPASIIEVVTPGPQGPSWPSEGVKAASEAAQQAAEAAKVLAQAAAVTAISQADSSTAQATAASNSAALASEAALAAAQDRATSHTNMVQTTADRNQTGLDVIAASQAQGYALNAAASADIAVSNASSAQTSATQAAASLALADTKAGEAANSAESAYYSNIDAAQYSGQAFSYSNTASTHAASALSYKNTAVTASDTAIAKAAIATAQAVIATDKATLTAADRVQTGLDAASAASSVATAQTLYADFTAVSSAASTAETKAAEASDSAVSAGLSKDSALASKISAEASAITASEQTVIATSAAISAQAWAITPVDTVVSGSDYSALHWAAKSAESQGVAGSFATSANDAKVAAQAAANNAVAVVTGGTASLTPAAGKIPIADSSGKIDVSWLDLLPSISNAPLHRSPNAITAMFVYDTSKDSDGGTWVEKCQHTSWYNEPLCGKWLGAHPSEVNARNQVAILGSELISNGTFTNDTVGWEAPSSSAVLASVNGAARLTANGAINPILRVATPRPQMVVGKSYRLSYRVASLINGSLTMNIYGPASAPQTGNNTTVTAGPQEFFFTATVSGDLVLSWQNWSGTSYFEIDNVSFREVTTQTTQPGDYYQLTTNGKFYKLNAVSGVTEVFRGNKNKFPRIATPIAEAASISVYDATEPGCPMWRRWSTAGAMSIGNISSVVAGQGRIYVGGSTGLAMIDLVMDRLTVINASNVRKQDFLTTTGAANLVVTSGGRIVNAVVNAVAMTVLPDAPTDVITGLKIPTIACLPGDTKITMKDGTECRIDEIKLGTFVKTLEGSSEVIGFFDQGVKSVIELEFDNGKKLTCTPDHKIRTSIGWVNAGDLNEEHDVVGL